MASPDYFVRAYNRDGSLYMETWHVGDHSKDMEVAAHRSRDPSCRIEVVDRRPTFRKSRP